MSKSPVIVVERYPGASDWTLSEFYIKGVRRGYGVEDEFRDVKVKGETRIPNGVYELDLRISPKFSGEYFRDETGRLSRQKVGEFKIPHEVIWVKDVPGFEFILWHWGNTDDDTDGCYIVGGSLATIIDQKGVGGSRNKYTEIYPEIRAIILAAKATGEKVFIEYRDKKTA